MPSSDKEAKVSTAKMIGFDVSVTQETHSGNRESLDSLDDGLDPVYQAKARILNEAIHEIGMGKYQVSLFVVQVARLFVKVTHFKLTCLNVSRNLFLLRKNQWFLFIVTGFGWFAYVFYNITSHILLYETDPNSGTTYGQ